MPIRSSMGLAVVVMVVDRVVGRGGTRGKVGWVVMGVGEGGVGVRGRVRRAESWCERSRLLSSSSCGWTSTSGSRNRGSSSEGEILRWSRQVLQFFVVPNGGSQVGVGEEWWWLTR